MAKELKNSAVLNFFWNLLTLVCRVYLCENRVWMYFELSDKFEINLMCMSENYAQTQKIQNEWKTIKKKNPQQQKCFRFLLRIFFYKTNDKAPFLLSKFLYSFACSQWVYQHRCGVWDARKHPMFNWEILLSIKPTKYAVVGLAAFYSFFLFHADRKCNLSNRK